MNSAHGSKAVLFNQSYHMAELMVEGPDALEFLSGLGINSFRDLLPTRPSSSCLAATTAMSSAM